MGFILTMRNVNWILVVLGVGFSVGFILTMRNVNFNELFYGEMPFGVLY